jgi:hypothetical protein
MSRTIGGELSRLGAVDLSDVRQDQRNVPRRKSCLLFARPVARGPGSSAGAIGFRFWIYMQNNSRRLAPVGPHGLRIEHPTVSDGVLFIARGQHVALGRDYSRSQMTRGRS